MELERREESHMICLVVSGGEGAAASLLRGDSLSYKNVELVEVERKTAIE